MKPNLSITNIFGKTFKLLIEKFHIIFPATIIVCILPMLLNLSGTFKTGSISNSPQTSPIILVVIWILTFLITPSLMTGLCHLLAKLARNEQASILDIFSGFKHPFKSFALYLLFSIICMMGMLCFMIPGIIFAAGFFAVFYLALDEGHGISDTLARAWEISKGSKLMIFLNTLLLMIVMFVIMMVGVFATVAPHFQEIANNPSAEPPASIMITTMIIMLFGYGIYFTFGATIYNELKIADSFKEDEVEAEVTA